MDQKLKVGPLSMLHIEVMYVVIIYLAAPQ